MIYKNPIFVVRKDNEKESTGGISIPDKDNKITLFSEIKGPFQDNLLSFKANDFFIKSDAFSEYDNSFSNEDFNFGLEYFDGFDFIKNNEINNFLENYNYLNEYSSKKNRNYLNNNLFEEKEKSKDDININLISNKSNRCDSLLIKFKAALGKWFITTINDKLKFLKTNKIIKRSIKLYSFNYKKFTLIVNYTQNKLWLRCKMKDLLLLGEEENQIKNKKAIKSLYKKDIRELNEIKDMLESDYRDIIKKFYLSEEFIKFRDDPRVKELDINFKKIMNINLLNDFGFISFFETRKGNNKKKFICKNNN